MIHVMTTRRRKATRKERQNAQRGSVLVEIALVLPVLLLIILGGIDLDLMVTSKSALNYVAGEGARCGAQTTPPCSTSSYVSQAAPGLGLNASGVRITSAPCTPGTACQLQLTYQWNPISPFFKTTQLTSTATAQP